MDCAREAQARDSHNMHLDMDYETLRRELPVGVEPAFDGLSLDFPTP